MRDIEVRDIEVTEDGPVVGVKDTARPVRLLVREWIHERHCRDVEVADDFLAVGSQFFTRTTVWAKGIPMKNLVPRPFWLIVRGEAGLLDVLRIDLATGEEALPVFSFEDEAGMFLELGALDGWRARVTTAGELISVLFGPCAGVGWVALDPLPGPDVTAWNALLSMERGAFMRFAANQRYGRYVSAGRSTGSGNRAGRRPPDRVGTKHGRALRPGQSMTDARQAGVIVPTATPTRR